MSKSVGYLTDFPDTIDFDAAMRLPRRDVMIIATGGQGEYRAALARIAFDQHKLKLDRGDLVIFSSKQIPGNEIAIGRIQNEFGQGIDIITTAGSDPLFRPSRRPSSLRCSMDPAEIVVRSWREAAHMGMPLRPYGVISHASSRDGDVVRLAPRPGKIGEEQVGASCSTAT